MEKNKKGAMMYRKPYHYVIQYIVLPAVLVGSDIFIGIFSHFTGAMGFESIFDPNLYSEYFSNHFDTFLAIVIIAISISLIVEYLIRDIEKNFKKK